MSFLITVEMIDQSIFFKLIASKLSLATVLVTC